MEGIIPRRNRTEIVRKFKRLTEKLPNFFQLVIMHPIPFDEKMLEKGGKFFFMLFKINEVIILGNCYWILDFPPGTVRIIPEKNPAKSKGKQAGKSKSTSRCEVSTNEDQPSSPVPQITYKEIEISTCHSNYIRFIVFQKYCGQFEGWM